MPGPLRRLRVAVHALDRTGPPMLALAFGRWLRRARPEVAVDVVAFRGGPLEPDAAALGSCTVLLRPSEAWDHARPDPERAAQVRAAAAALPPADATLLVSVAAGQVLASVADGGAVVTWCVELGDDLHWIDEPIGLVEQTDRWVAGAEVVRDEVVTRLGPAAGPVEVVGEFVGLPDPDRADLADAARAVRAELGVGDGELLCLGAGIATHRKAPDLFVEVAAARRRRAPDAAEHAHWVGGSDDELYGPVTDEVARLGLGPRVALHPPVADLDAWMAAADVFVHPARLDAFPLVCLHAAAVGTPVVGFAGVGGLEEMFGDAFVGVPYPDVTGLADAVGALADPAVRAEVAERQRQRVVARWSAEARAPRVLAAIEGAR